MSGILEEALAEGVVSITLNRPETLNALTAEVVGALHETLDDLRERQDCRAIILTGAGRGFCAGMDLTGYGDDDRIQRRGLAAGKFARQREIAGLVEKIRRMPQVIVAAVNGPAVGAGLALVAASDIRIAATEAVFATGFIRAGLSGCDVGVSWALPRLIGVARAHELMLTGDRFNAEDALAWGLVTHVVPREALLEQALERAAAILRHPPLSVELTKVGMWAAVEMPSLALSIEFENRQQVLVSMTEDSREARTALLDKREPRYTGR